MTPPAVVGTSSPRNAAAGIYLPALVFEIGIGAILPVVALSARALGSSLAVAGIMVALLGVGQILGDVPAGALATRLGDRQAMLVAAGLAALTLATCALAPSLWLLAIGVLALGAANAVFMLARQAYLTEVTPVINRARAMSTLGGVQRFGTFAGPFLGAALMQQAGLRSVYWLAVGTTVVAGAVVAMVPDAAGEHVLRARQAAKKSAWSVLRDHRQLFATLGLAALAVSAARAGRQVVLPLWSEHLGLSNSTTSLVFGISGAADLLLFYPGGKLMDRRGRLWVGIPAMLVLGSALVALPLTHSLGGLIVVAIVMGLGNGIGSGILMTLGADAAPPAIRSQFLGVWRLIQDSGYAAGPFVVSTGAALGSLAAGIIGIGAVGLAGAGALARWVPRWTVHANRTTRRRAGLRDDGRERVDPDGDGAPIL